LRRRHSQGRRGLRRGWREIGSGWGSGQSHRRQTRCAGRAGAERFGQLPVALDLLDRRLRIPELRRDEDVAIETHEPVAIEHRRDEALLHHSAALLLAEYIVPSVLVERVGNER
jgi:hypothetical protein